MDYTSTCKFKDKSARRTCFQKLNEPVNGEHREQNKTGGYVQRNIHIQIRFLLLLGTLLIG